MDFRAKQLLWTAGGFLAAADVLLVTGTAGRGPLEVKGQAAIRPFTRCGESNREYVLLALLVTTWSRPVPACTSNTGNCCR
jgi:hypothetical protein